METIVVSNTNILIDLIETGVLEQFFLLPGKIVVTGIGIYQKEKLSVSVDLKFDSHGNLIPFSKNENGSHSHLWGEISPGIIGRKSHDKSNYFSIDSKLDSLIAKIVDFNQKGKIWKKDTN